MDDAREVVRLSEREEDLPDRPSDANHPSTGTGASTWASAPPDSSSLAELLDLVDQAVVVCDRSARLQWCNAAAKAAVPGLRYGEVLAGPLLQALTRGSERFAAIIGGRYISGRRAAGSGASGTSQYAWFLQSESSAPAGTPDTGAGVGRSAFLDEANQRLRVSLHPGRTVRAIADTAAPTLADTAVVLLPVRGDCGHWHRAGLEPASGRFSKSAIDSSPLLAQALSGQLTSPIRCGRLALAGLADVLTPWSDEDGPALVAVLPGAGAPSGILILARGPGRQPFDADDTDLAREFAARAGMALTAAASYAEHADVTTALRGQLVPLALPSLPEIRLAAAHRPAQEGLHLGGDFYYARPAAHGSGIDFALGDVCGNGAEAAVIGGRVRGGLKALAAVENQPVAVLRHLNTLLLEEDVTAFVTLVIGSARPAEGGALDIVVAGGGHLAPLVLRGDGRVEEVSIGGTLVGALSEADFEQSTVRLAAGDSMLLYSDGITEANGGPSGREMYGDQRLARDLATCAEMPAEAVAERIDLLLGRWLGGRPHDDLALLVIQAPPVVRDEHTGLGVRGLAA